VKYLLWLDAILAAFGGVMMLAIGFVGGMFWLYVDTSPKTKAGLPSVVIITVCFAVLFAVALAAFLGLRRRRRWHWAAQAVLMLSLPLIYEVVLAHLQTP